MHSAYNVKLKQPIFACSHPTAPFLSENSHNTPQLDVKLGNKIHISMLRNARRMARKHDN
jgi:hypothetical protein